jgi:hypothetical protein
MLKARRGHTVIEMLVALSVGAIVVGLSATIGFRHQRFHRDVVVTVERTEQLEQSVALLPISLRAIAPGEGDISPGAARDTSLEFRATIGSAVVCDTVIPSKVILAPVVEAPHLTSLLTRPEAGDTAWVLSVEDSTERWLPRAITGVSNVSARCAIGGSLPFGEAPRTSLALALNAPPPTGAVVVRITRPWRYSLYRASDGAWYLGAKDWNPALVRFNTIQPVAGPFVSAAASGLRFRYSDSLGAALAPATLETRRIALIEVALRVDSVLAGKYAHAARVHGRSTAAISLRNRLR